MATTTPQSRPCSKGEVRVNELIIISQKLDWRGLTILRKTTMIGMLARSEQRSVVGAWHPPQDVKFDIRAFEQLLVTAHGQKEQPRNPD